MPGMIEPKNASTSTAIEHFKNLEVNRLLCRSIEKDNEEILYQV